MIALLGTPEMTKDTTAYRTFFLLVAALLLGGMAKIAYADDAAAQLARGAEIFAANCATCHGPTEVGS